MKRHVPNALTILNLLAGSSAVFFLFQDRLELVFICMIISLASDVLDGLLARLLGVNSDVGVELDSMADLISFGLLPSCILIWLMMYCDQQPANIWLIAGFLLTGATALRLARFNLDRRDPSVFYGLPCPSSAAFVFGLLILAETDSFWASIIACRPAVFFGVIVILSFLMLSGLRLWSLKGLQKPNGKFILAGLLSVFAILVVWQGFAAVPIFIAVYIGFGLLNTLAKVY